MTQQDIVIGSLCAWRENRGGGRIGMQSVLNVLNNRANKHLTSVYTEATHLLQFSSMTSKGDPQLTIYPSFTDNDWITALQMAADENLVDITGGATNYYSLTMENPPVWARAMTHTYVIANQAFYK